MLMIPEQLLRVAEELAAELRALTNLAKQETLVAT
jgi:hypothetical protein